MKVARPPKEIMPLVNDSAARRYRGGPFSRSVEIEYSECCQYVLTKYVRKFFAGDDNVSIVAKVGTKL